MKQAKRNESKGTARIILPYGGATRIAKETGIDVQAVRLYLKGVYGKESPAFVKQQQVRRMAMKMIG